MRAQARLRRGPPPDGAVKVTRRRHRSYPILSTDTRSDLQDHGRSSCGTVARPCTEIPSVVLPGVFMQTRLAGTASRIAKSPETEIEAPKRGPVDLDFTRRRPHF